MTSKEIISRLPAFFPSYDYDVDNCYIYQWESDYWAISKSGYSIEVEVKVTKADFLNDFKYKTDKHQLLEKKHWVVKRRDRGGTEEQQYAIMFDTDHEKFRSSYLNPQTTISIYSASTAAPNKFAFCVPEGLVSVEEIPEYAGLIYINERNKFRWIKKPPFIHKKKNDYTKKLLEKFYYNYRNSRIKIYDLEAKLQRLKNERP